MVAWHGFFLVAIGWMFWEAMVSFVQFWQDIDTLPNFTHENGWLEVGR